MEKKYRDHESACLPSLKPEFDFTILMSYAGKLFFLFLRSCSEGFPQNFLVFFPLQKPALQMIDNTLDVKSPRANATAYILYWISNIQLSVQSNLGLHRFSFTLLCDWSRKLALLFQPIRRNIKSNHGLVVRAFGGLVGFILSSHWLLNAFSHLLIGRWHYFGFGFMTLNRKGSKWGKCHHNWNLKLNVQEGSGLSIDLNCATLYK